MVGEKTATLGRILVIDDEPEITEIIKAYMSNAGYEVEVENEPQNGIQDARNFKPNVIILDIQMPFMDGYDVCSQLRADPDTAETPVLFLTGKDVREDRGKAFGVGGDFYIKKPFSCERLLQMVKTIMVTVNKPA
jgi:DNA-binding response OmpR family regulator